MRDAPCLRAGGTLLEGGEVARLRRGGVGHAPDQGADGEIAHDHHDAVGERDTDEAPPAADLGEAAEKLGARINEIEHEERDGADEKACRDGRGGAQLRVLVLAAALGEEILGDLAQHFAGGGVAGLHHHRVQSPEAILDEAEQGAPAEPAQGENESEDQNRPDADGERGDAVRQRAHPIGDGDRGEAEQQPWYDQQQRPGHEQLRQADLDEEAAGKRQHGVLLGARHVGFDVAAARVDERLPQRSSIISALHPAHEILACLIGASRSTLWKDNERRA